MTETLGERVTRAEVRIEAMSTRLNSIETSCTTKHIRVDEADERLRVKIDSIQKNDIHSLQQQINAKRKTELSVKDWVKIIVAIIVTSGVIIGAVLQFIK